MALTEDEESMVRAIIAIYKTQAPSLSTDVASRAAALFAAWDGNGHAYAEGERVSCEGELYVCLQAHTSQTDWAPTAAPSRWTKAIAYASGGDDPSSIPEWVRPSNENPYPKGAVVRHNGKVWESLVANNVWEPGAVGTETVWREVTKG